MLRPILAAASAIALIAAASPALAQTRPERPTAPATNPGDNATSSDTPKDVFETPPAQPARASGHPMSSSMPSSRMPATRLPSSKLPYGPSGPTGVVPGPTPSPAPGEPTETRPQAA